jgi:hypothetical protein
MDPKKHQGSEQEIKPNIGQPGFGENVPRKEEESEETERRGQSKEREEKKEDKGYEAPGQSGSVDKPLNQ